jgi:hypothetical protein
MAEPSQFVADGYERARAASEPEIVAQVEAEFAERLRTAAFWGRLWLKREMRREIERRIEARAPSGALY